MLRGFRDFVLRGNVLDLAVAVVIGTAFTAVVTSFARDLLVPAIAAVAGRPDFGELVLGPIRYGAFITALVNFLIVAFALYLIVTAARRIARPDTSTPSVRSCPFCLTDIAPTASRCPACTSEVEPSG